jgi:hypothetical protein
MEKFVRLFALAGLFIGLLFWRRRERKIPKIKPKSRTFRPQLEQLESRLTPSASRLPWDMLPPMADLNVTAFDHPALGGFLAVEFSVQNVGQVATEASLTIQCDGLKFVPSVSSAGLIGADSSPSIFADLGELQPGESRKVSAAFDVSNGTAADGIHQISALVVSRVPESNLGDNTAMVQTWVAPHSKLDDYLLSHPQPALPPTEMDLQIVPVASITLDVAPMGPPVIAALPTLIEPAAVMSTMDLPKPVSAPMPPPIAMPSDFWVLLNIQMKSKIPASAPTTSTLLQMPVPETTAKMRVEISSKLPSPDTFASLKWEDSYMVGSADHIFATGELYADPLTGSLISPF